MSSVNYAVDVLLWVQHLVNINLFDEVRYMVLITKLQMEN